MISGRAAHFVSVATPWGAAVDTRSPWPARYYAALIAQAIRYGMPSTRRLGRLWSFAGRRGIPEREMAAVLRRLPRRPRPDVEGLLANAASAWPSLAEQAARLPSARPTLLTALAIERSAGLTTFVFGDEPPPLLVLKVPHGSDAALRLDATALREAAPADVAPRALGTVGGAYAQEALPGTPLRVEPLTVAGVSELCWPRSLESLGAGLTRLSTTTVKSRSPVDVAPFIEVVKADRDLSPRARRTIGAAGRDVRGLSTSVLRHRDTSAQNCLFRGDRLIGIVDWEMSTPAGSPGFDTLNAALAWVEHGLGLERWSEQRAVAALASGWAASRFWTAARGAARAAASAGGVPERHQGALETLFFAARTGARATRPERRWVTGVEASRAMLEVVCAS